MSKLAAETIVKSPGETILVDFIFPSGDFGSGVNLAGTPTITEVTTTALTLDNKVVSGKNAQVRIAGGAAGTTYTLKCNVDDDGSPAQTHEAHGRLLVEALG